MNLKRLFATLILSVFVFATQAIAQEKVVTGKVTDANGAAVANVTIKVKGGKALGATNADGTFSVKVPENATLQFSSIGFSTVEMQVPASGNMSVSLKSSSDNLGEVVVIGYGSAKKKDLTGSVATVSSKDFVKGALASPEQLITGKVAGVSITSNGGAPGAGSVIRIRGGASLSASNDPLIIIDGMPIDNNGIPGSANTLNLINPNDIESMNILKDASAAAIYGARASNGVIIITTKKGKSGKPTFTFSSVSSVYTPASKVDVMSASQFRDFVNANGSSTYKSLMGTASTNWQDQIFKTSFGVDNNMSMSGAIFKKVPFRASLGYLNQQGILRGGSIKRTTASIVMSPKFFKDHLKVDINIKGTANENKFANEGAIGAAVLFDPTQPVYSGSKRFGGYWEWLDPNSATGLKSLAPLNPLGLLQQKDDRSHVERSIGNIQFDYKFHGLPELRAVLNLGYDIARSRGLVVINDSAAMSYKSYKDANGVYHGGTYAPYKQDKQNKLAEAYLQYTKSFKTTDVDVMVGHSYQEYKDIFYNNPSSSYDLASTISTSSYEAGTSKNSIESYFGRVRLGFKNRYLLSASIRRDGSSKFSKSNRWATFPSAAFAWRINEEGFLKGVKAINELKLRVQYGVTGQQDGIPLYDYLPYYALTSYQSQYQFGNTFYNGYTPLNYSPDRKWEQTEMKNVALDFALFNNRVTGSIEYYDRTTKDLLANVYIPAGSLSNQLVKNIGTQNNQGVELTLNLGMIKKKDFTWDVSFNATYNKNKITGLTDALTPDFVGNRFGGISGGTGNTILINAINKPRGAFYVYKQVYDKAGKPIDGLFEDMNRDGIINEKDLYVYKQTDPRVFMGLSTSVTYKKWNAGFVMRASLDNYLYNNVHSNTGTVRNILDPIGVLHNGSTEVLNSGMSGNGTNFYMSDYWVQNASFIRMDNINIGYNFGKVFSNKANLRVTANVQNVFVITKYKGLDPEVYGGIDNNFYPRPRVFVLGVSLDF